MPLSQFGQQASARISCWDLGYQIFKKNQHQQFQGSWCATEGIMDSLTLRWAFSAVAGNCLCKKQETWYFFKVQSI